MAINQIKAGAALNYVIIALNAIVGLLYTPYMLRMLGQNEYGLYSLVASLIAYLTILDFGFGNAIVRYTAKFRAENKVKEQQEMFGMFLIVYSLIGLVALFGGILLYENVETLFDRTMTPQDISQARVMMLLLTVNLALTFPLSIFGSIITAYEDFVFQRVVNILRILLSTVIMIFLLSAGYKAIALVLVQTIFNILTLLINVFYCRKKLRIRIAFNRFNYRFFKEIACYSFWIFLNVIMDKIYWGTGQFVLGTISGTTAVAIFSVAILLQQMYMTFSTAISSVLLPKITAMVSAGNNRGKISDLFIRTGRIQCIVMALILGGFIVFGHEFINIWAGKEYSVSYIITLIFFVALLIPLIQNTGVVILQARNQMKFRSLLYLGISILSLILQILLSRSYGAVGCATAIAVSLLIGQGIVMNIYYSKVQHINILRFWKEVSQVLISAAILTFIGIIGGKFIDLNVPYRMFVGIALFVIAYTAISWKWILNDQERAMIVTSLKRIKVRHD